MAFLTAGYIDQAIGTATRVALAANTAAVLFFEKLARAEVQAAAQVAGYSLGNTSTNDMVQWLALAQWFRLAGGLKKGLVVPDAVQVAIEDLQLVREGKKPIPGISPSTEDGIGGTKFSESSDTSESARVQYFSRAKLSTW